MSTRFSIRRLLLLTAVVAVLLFIVSITEYLFISVWVNFQDGSYSRPVNISYLDEEHNRAGTYSVQFSFNYSIQLKD